MSISMQPRRRDRAIMIRVTEQERNEFRAIASFLGIRISKMVRDAVLPLHRKVNQPKTA